MQRGFERVVVPIGGADSDARALDILPDLFSKNGGTVTILYVLEVPQSMPLDAELPNEVAAGDRALRLAEAATRKALPTRTVRIVTELLQARAAGPAIVDEAVDRAAEAIIMTAAVRRRYGRLTLGGTTEHVLLHAPCEVLVVRASHPNPADPGSRQP
jgi:nucleotide-binding universal stress UspA family protein